jgi:hypothetical protein
LHLTACSHAESVEFGKPLPLGTVRDKKLEEVSGMVASRRNLGVLWVHNDGSNGRLFALHTNGQVLATYKLTAEVVDVEDIAIGPGPEAGTPYIYLGDTGDNNGNRKFIRVYRFAEPVLPSDRGSNKVIDLREFDTIQLRYPDGRYDAEALMIDPHSGDLFIVTKQQKKARIYCASKKQLTNGAEVTLLFVCELSFREASAGDISPSGGEIILRWEAAARLWRRRLGESIQDAFSRTPVAVPVVGPPKEPNGESIAFHPNGGGYYTLSEGRNQPIYFIPRTRRE